MNLVFVSKQIFEYNKLLLNASIGGLICDFPKGYIYDKYRQEVSVLYEALVHFHTDS